MKLLYYKFQQLTLLQIAMDSYYKLLQLFPYKGVLWQDFTKCDVSITDCVAYKARYKLWEITTVNSSSNEILMILWLCTRSIWSKFQHDPDSEVFWSYISLYWPILVWFSLCSSLLGITRPKTRGKFAILAYVLLNCNLFSITLLPDAALIL